MRKRASALARAIDAGASHLASLVLGDLVLGVLVALLGLAVSPAGLGNVDLCAEMYELPVCEDLQFAVSPKSRFENRRKKSLDVGSSHSLDGR